MTETKQTQLQVTIIDTQPRAYAALASVYDQVTVLDTQMHEAGKDWLRRPKVRVELTIQGEHKAAFAEVARIGKLCKVAQVVTVASGVVRNPAPAPVPPPQVPQGRKEVLAAPLIPIPPSPGNGNGGRINHAKIWTSQHLLAADPDSLASKLYASELPRKEKSYRGKPKVDIKASLKLLKETEETLFRFKYPPGSAGQALKLAISTAKAQALLPTT